MHTVTIRVQWRLLERPETEGAYQIVRGTLLADFLPGVLAGMKADEVIAVFNGRPVTLLDTLEEDGILELIPMLCGG